MGGITAILIEDVRLKERPVAYTVYIVQTRAGSDRWGVHIHQEGSYSALTATVHPLGLTEERARSAALALAQTLRSTLLIEEEQRSEDLAGTTR